MVSKVGSVDQEATRLASSSSETPIIEGQMELLPSPQSSKFFQFVRPLILPQLSL